MRTWIWEYRKKKSENQKQKRWDGERRGGREGEKDIRKDVCKEISRHLPGGILRKKIQMFYSSKKKYHIVIPNPKPNYRKYYSV